MPAHRRPWIEPVRQAGVGAAIAWLLLGVPARAQSQDVCAAPRQSPRITLSDAARVAPPSAWNRGPVAIEGFAQAGGRHLIAGAGVDWALSTGFSLHVGGGWSATPGAPMADLVGRLRLVLTPALGAGAEAGFLVDGYEARESCTSAGCRTWTWSTAVWGKVGVHTELRTELGLTLRMSAGATSIFNTPDARCQGCQPGDAPRLWSYSLPYFGLAAGWVFGS